MSLHNLKKMKKKNKIKKPFFNPLDLLIVQNKGDYTDAVYEAARERIILAYLPVLNYNVNRLVNLWPNTSSEEELITAGLLAIIEGFELWDPNYKSKQLGREGRTAAITTYIYTSLHRRLLNVIRRKTANKRKYNVMFSLNAPVTNDPNGDTEWQDYLPANDRGMKRLVARDYIRELCKYLDEDDKNLLSAYIVAHTGNEMSQMIGMSREGGRLRMVNLRKKIKKIIKKEKL